MKVDRRASWTSEANGADKRPKPYPYAGVAVHWPGEPGRWALEDGSHDECARRLRGMEASQMGERPPYAALAYQLVACQHGRLITGRGVDRVNAANSGEGNLTHGSVLGLLGMDDVPTPAMLHAITQAPAALNARDVLLPHSHFRPTACPGPRLTLWLAAGAPDPGADDVPLTPADAELVADAVWNREVNDPTTPGSKARAARLLYLAAGGEDPTALAAALAAALPTGVVTTEQLTQALRTVLGSLDEGATP
jgi:hypothetical protein